MKICGIQFNRFSQYIGLSVFAFCCLSGGLLFATPAKAEITVATSTVVNNTDTVSFTVPSEDVCPNAMIVVFTDTYSSRTSMTAWWGSEEFTSLEHITGGNANFFVNYLANPTPGTGNLTFSITPNDARMFEPVLFCGVDSIDNHSTFSQLYPSNVDITGISIANDDSYLITYIGGYGTNLAGVKSPNEILFRSVDDWRSISIDGHSYSTGYASTGFTYYQDGGVGNGGYLVLKPAAAPAPSGYCGDGICNGDETGSTCIDCLTFYDMTTLQDTYLYFDKVINYCPINSSCSIKYHFDNSIFNPTTDYGMLYYYANSTSSPEYLGNILPLATGWELGDLDSGQFIASSTTTSTEFSYYAIKPCKTFGGGGCWGTSTVAVWFTAPPSYDDIIAGVWVATSSTSTDDMLPDFNMTAYQLACSDDQWHGDWITQIGCYYRFSTMVLEKKAGEIISQAMSRTWSSLKNMFPFNFANLMNTSWAAANVNGVPADLAFLDMLDDDGNISFDFSAMTGTTTKLVFWGANTFNNTGGEFTKVRSLSKYLFYGLLLLYIYLKGKSVYNELAGNNTNQND
jgi:hypothetical protein